ncbi:YhcU family protein [Aquibacillus sp. 3ASR75-11]|uniref:YhcU family protein n=1 Tax=Terrihalobacillus insolitus TaxID=2950438 RepID=A0A9X3WV05_9BACI|nr:DUF5365 family protein [Terrihalobacillus insolitus]MDC3412978.1 YhcU family protein [Terrihalobacillus insolitus]MDC3424731.1 YhcU family protein [Terrihalobacillus insolitus]
MKVVIASTPEQHVYIKEQVDYLFHSVFPMFFPLSYIASLQQFNILDDSHLQELNLQEIMEATAAIQMIKTILENKIEGKRETSAYEELFNKNTNILNKYQLDFPFRYQDFSLLSPE